MATAAPDLMGDPGPAEELVRKAVEEEREACAAMLESEAQYWFLMHNDAAGHTLEAAAAAIRRRGA